MLLRYFKEGSSCKGLLNIFLGGRLFHHELPSEDDCSQGSVAYGKHDGRWEELARI